MRDGPKPQPSVQRAMIQQLRPAHQQVFGLTEVCNDHDRFGEGACEVLRDGRLLPARHVCPEFHNAPPGFFEGKEVREIT